MSLDEEIQLLAIDLSNGGFTVFNVLSERMSMIINKYDPNVHGRRIVAAFLRVLSKREFLFLYNLDMAALEDLLLDTDGQTLENAIKTAVQRHSS